MTTPPQIEDVYPLSSVQKGMLFHSVAEPGAGLYVIQSGYDLRGAYDDAVSRGAWAAVVARHAVLRTSFAWQTQEDPRQVVHRQVKLPWKTVDLRASSPEEQRVHVARAYAEDRAAGFELARPPLLRFTVFRLADDRHHLLWTIHHLLIDGWSMQIVLREVSQAYLGAQGTAPGGEPPSYRTFIGWLLAQDGGRAEAFWRRTLAGIKGPTPIVGKIGRASCRERVSSKV